MATCHKHNMGHGGQGMGGGIGSEEGEKTSFSKGQRVLVKPCGVR